MTSTSGKTGNSLECFPVDLNFLYGNDFIMFPRLMGSNDDDDPWHCVNTHLTASDQQTDKGSAFIEVLQNRRHQNQTD